MSSLVESRWFALADLACAGTAGIWWVLAPQAGAWPLAIALLPWGMRLAAGKSPAHRTALDIPIGIFLLTAGVGIWAAYDRAAAWNKFWLIAGSVLLYYALAAQPRSNGWVVAGLTGVLGASISIYFLLTHDWVQYPADLSILNRLGRAWMSVRPGVHGPWVHPNIAGGLLAMLLPVNLAWLLDACQRLKRGLLLTATGLCGILAIGLLMTSSRAAWAALIAGLGTWGWWHISGLTAQRYNWNRRLTFGLPILLAVFLTLGVLGLRAGSLVRTANTLPGEANAGSRAEITRNTIQLIRDYPFTGGGLASFSGLYSIYIRVIQVPEFFYSHNLFLDIALEQGLPGLAAFLSLMAGAVWIVFNSLAANPTRNHLAGASLASLGVVLLHGFLDDALYGMGGTPLVFLIPGIVASLQFQSPERVQEKSGSRPILKKLSPLTLVGVLGSALIVIGLAVIVFAKPLASAWYANMGTVAMSRIQLRGWPDSSPETQSVQQQLAPIMDLFSRAKDQDPNNPTALYRLGLYAYNSNDFEQATGYLESAYARNPGHRGIQKLLGYTYTWAGNFLNAKPLLSKIPEAKAELNAYSWWWGTQNRADLAEFASQMATQLQQK